MKETILKIISVYFSSMLKFILGPLGGYATGLNLITTILTTIAGMMTIVFLFTYFGNWLQKNVLSKFFRNKNKFSVSNKKFVMIWKKYGLVGVAVLTPIILTPIGGTILAVSSGSPREKIILYMLISAIIWSIALSGAIYFFGEQVLPEILKP